MGEAARALDLDHSTVAYHVRRLEKAGAIVAERCGRYVRLYVNGDRPKPPSEPPAGSRRETCQSYVRAHPGADVEVAAEAARISRQATSVDLRSLAADDVVELDDAGGRLRVRPTGFSARVRSVSSRRPRSEGSPQQPASQQVPRR